MHLSEIEKDILGDLAQDSHELWEIFAFVRSSEQSLQEDQVILRGYQFITSWVGKGWLKASVSRTNNNNLSGEQLIIAIRDLGPHASDPSQGIILLELTDRALNDIEGIPKPRRR